MKKVTSIFICAFTACILIGSSASPFQRRQHVSNIVLTKDTSRLNKILDSISNPGVNQQDKKNEPAANSSFLEIIKDKVESTSSTLFDNSFRIVQFGDSHTAGDFFSERMRAHLQARFGNAGIGWILPFSVSGQRSAQYSLQSRGSWQTHYQKGRSSRQTLPFGGYLATGSQGSSLSVASSPGALQNAKLIRFSVLARSASNSPSAISLSANVSAGEKIQIGREWRVYSKAFDAFTSKTFRLDVLNGNAEIAALYLDSDAAGVTYEAVGRNGSELKMQNYWSTASFKALLKNRMIDMIVFAYGTNEAVDNISTVEYIKVLRQRIEEIQKINTTAPIVLITVPSFAQGPTSSCRQPASLGPIHDAQVSVATLYPNVYVWSWLKAMGGHCSVSDWARNGYVARDWIHFSASGYRKSADLFYQWFTLPKAN